MKKTKSRGLDLLVIRVLLLLQFHVIKNKETFALNQFYQMIFGRSVSSAAERQKCKQDYLIKCDGSGSPQFFSSCSRSSASSCWGSCVVALPRAPTAALHRFPPAPSSPCSSSVACRCADWASKSSPSGRHREKNVNTHIYVEICSTADGSDQLCVMTFQLSELVALSRCPYCCCIRHFSYSIAKNLEKSQNTHKI